MKKLNHDHVDYLKVDVEGYEWDFLSTVDWSTTKVEPSLSLNFIGVGQPALTARVLNAIFNKLEEAGCRLISLEPVTYGNWGQVELVFMHEDWKPLDTW
jgi:hypothetical protein